MSMKRGSILRIEVTERLTPVFGGIEAEGAAWAARVAEATEALVEERLLLREDADRPIAAKKVSRDVLAVL